MSMYKYIDSTLQSQYKERGDVYRAKIAEWRRNPPIVRVERPANLARARELGYKAKQGIIVVRVRIIKGMRKRAKARGGRKPSKSGRFFSYHKSFQAMAEERASRKFMNCEVMNSYYVGEDGKYKFFEAILLDRSHPALKNDRFYSTIIAHKGRAFRGLTSAGRKHREELQK
ncbi:MAG: 50S ribosomal protein L15e [Candidatus Micrarchaeota archaeon]|nr:50S ribosomal protein L15e [Candidatus Micrarchaeota archaeon]